MTELQHLQKVILGIIKDVDILCKKNNIEYYLFGGSAIGAIRHKGFIPWDDDLDIVMNYQNYDKFIKVCREQLDSEKYYFQEGLVDWPMMFSKVRLKGTVMDEPGLEEKDSSKKGIYIDVFKLDNAPDSTLLRKWQYVCGKYFLAYCILQRKYKEAPLYKKVIMYSAYPLKVPCIRNFFKHQMEKYNNCETSMYASFGARFKYKNSFYKKELYANPIYVSFEDTKLPVPEKYDEMLTMIYGDYMTPPPVKEQQGWHMQKVDFGQY